MTVGTQAAALFSHTRDGIPLWLILPVKHHWKSLNLRSSFWTECFGYGFRARQVGMCSGSSIQSLWAMPACLRVSDRLVRASSSGAWKTQTSFNKAVAEVKSGVIILLKEATAISVGANVTSSWTEEPRTFLRASQHLC